MKIRQSCQESRRKPMRVIVPRESSEESVSKGRVWLNKRNTAENKWRMTENWQINLASAFKFLLMQGGGRTGTTCVALGISQDISLTRLFGGRVWRGGLFREKEETLQIVNIEYLCLRPPGQMGQLLNLQAKKIITKHKNPSLSSRELDLNLQREGLAGWRYHPRIPFLQSSSIYVPGSLRLYGNSREQNRQNSLTWGANSPMSLYF